MIKVDQTKFGPSEGNCLAACIASVLEIPLAEVPELNNQDLHQMVVLNQWLKKYDLQFAWVPYATYTGDVPYNLAAGLTERGRRHAIVCNASGTMLHDPHPSRAGLIGTPLDFGIFIAMKPYWIFLNARA